MFALNMPLLAAGGTAISILFLVIAFVSWLWNVFNGNQNAGAPGRPQPMAGGAGNRGNKDLNAEINRFLKNVMGQKPDQGEELEVLVAEDESKPSRSRNKNRAKRDSAARGAAAASADSTEGRGARPGGRISQRKGPGSANLGSGVRQHLADHMQEGRVTQQAQSHLAHGVAEKVQKDMGIFSAADTGPKQAVANVTATGVANLMRDPAGLKQAFVLNLILNRPAAGGRRRG